MLLLHLYLPIPPPVVLSAKVHLFSLIYLTVHNCNGMKRLVARQKKVGRKREIVRWHAWMIGNKVGFWMDDWMNE